MTAVVKLPTCSHPTKKKAKAKKPNKTKRRIQKALAEAELRRPTYPWWERERYIKRRTSWMWRLKPFLDEKNKVQCGSCQMNGRCHRVPLDEEITADIASGKECKDYKSMWKAIVGDQEEYDWGF